MTAPISSMIVPALDNALKSLLMRAGVENPDGDAREILCAVLECDRTQLILREEDVPEQLCEKAIAMARRRVSGEPIQYILGSWSFMGRDYTVGEGVLIPRDDTEVVVTEALKLCESIPHPVIVDLCAGSGIIATENIALNQAKVNAIHADLQNCVNDFEDGSLDMIVSNPPYIRSSEIAELQQEVQYEPRLALDGGEDGYDFYKMMISLWTPKLKKGGAVAFEVGEGQFDTIADMLKNAGYTAVSGTPDIQNITRAITAKKEHAL